MLRSVSKLRLSRDPVPTDVRHRLTGSARHRAVRGQYSSSHVFAQAVAGSEMVIPCAVFGLLLNVHLDNMAYGS